MWFVRVQDGSDPSTDSTVGNVGDEDVGAQEQRDDLSDTKGRRVCAHSRSAVDKL